jgi:glycosyltransferase involved in cell wall biosynthesis
MRILIVMKMFSSTSGGAENQVYNMVMHLKHKHNFTIVCSNAVETGSIKGVTITTLPVSFRFMYYIYSRKLKQSLEKIIPSFDLVHCHNYCCYYVDTAARMAKKNGVPLVITNHGIFPSRNFVTAIMMFFYNKLIGSKTLNLADKILSINECSMEKMNRIGAPVNRNIVVHNGINLQEFKVAPDRNYRKRIAMANEKVVVYASRLEPEKGLGFLVESLEEALTKGKNLKLAVAGDDTTSYAGKVKKLIMKKGLEKRVIFLGRLDRKELVQLYKSGSVFALPSAYEPFGVVLLEAMACGLPIVATNVGGVPEILAGTGNALVDYGDTNGFAESILEMAGKRGVGEANKIHVMRYSYPNIAKQIDDVYSSFKSVHRQNRMERRQNES